MPTRTRGKSPIGIATEAPDQLIEGLETPSPAERRRARSRLRHHLELASAITTHVAEGLCLIDAAGRLTYMNPAAEEMLGWRQEELFGRILHDEVHYRHPDGRPFPSTDCSLLNVLQERVTIREREEVWIRKGGETFPALCSCTPIVQDGVITGAVLSLHDITERKRVEETLRRDAAMLDLANDTILIRNLDDTIAYWNRGAERLYGWCEEDVLGKDVHTVLQTVFPKPLGEIREELFRAGRWTGELVHTTRSGEQVATASRWMVWQMEDGEPKAILETNHDISERKWAEEALQEEARLVSTLQRIGSALTAELNPHKIVQAVTDEATSLTGAQFGAFLYGLPDEQDGGFPLFTLSGASGEALERLPLLRDTPLFARTLRGEGPIRSDDIARAPHQGEAGPCQGASAGHPPVKSYLAVPVMSRSGEVLGGLFFGHEEPGVFKERHERIAVGIAGWASVAMDNARLYEAERRARAEAEEANRSKADFLAAMSHELRTPLNAISGYADLLEMGIHGPVTDAQSRALGRIKLSGQHLLSLITDILNFAKLEAGRVEFTIEDVSLGTLLTATETLVGPQVRAKKLSYAPGYCDVKTRVRGDPEKIQQVLLNLMTNAIKFTDEGGEIAVWCDSDSEAVRIRVRDTGRGIPAGRLESIFDPFVQVDRHLTQASQQGVGLGLAISRDLARGMGGDLSVESTPGEGSIFTFTLPFAGIRK